MEDEKKVKVLELNIGETNPAANTLIAMEMSDTKKTGFRRHSAARKKSIDRIFGKMSLIDVENDADTQVHKKMPRRSLVMPNRSLLTEGPDESDGPAE